MSHLTASVGTQQHTAAFQKAHECLFSNLFVYMQPEEALKSMDQALRLEVAIRNPKSEILILQGVAVFSSHSTVRPRKSQSDQSDEEDTSMTLLVCLPAAR